MNIIIKIGLYCMTFALIETIIIAFDFSISNNIIFLLSYALFFIIGLISWIVLVKTKLLGKDNNDKE